MDAIKVPGPDHPITLAAHPGRTRALYEGHVIADSADVLMLSEATYKPVAYFPRGDVDMAYLSRTSHDTHCPYKGHAAYFTLMMDGAIAENAAWTYESPYPAMQAIAGRVAFFPNAVTIEATTAGLAGASVDEVIQHTDAGGGVAQRDHWAATVSEPPTAEPDREGPGDFV